MARKNKGIAALPVLILLTLIILLVGIAVSGVGFIEGALALDQTQSREAYYIAEMGINDALMKLARDKNFVYASPGYCLNNACNTDRYANITVTGTDVKIITSDGFVKNKQRRIQVTTQNIQTNNGKIIINAGDWKEL